MMDLSKLPDHEIDRLACEAVGMEPKHTTCSEWDLIGERYVLKTLDTPVYRKVSTDPAANAELCQRALDDEHGITSRLELVWFGCGWKARVALYRGMTQWRRHSTNQFRVVTEAVAIAGIAAGIVEEP